MRLHRNIYIWYANTFLSFAEFTLPIWVIFNTDILGLSNTQAFILGVLPYGLSALLEVPTGSWADKFGRAKIYQLGLLLYILSIASFIFISNFYILLIFQVIGALGLALKSGSIEALVHDSIDTDKHIVYAKVHGHKMAILFTSRVIAAIAGGLLFTVDPRAPFIAATIACSLGFGASLFYKEVRAETPSELTSFDHIKETWTLIIRSKIFIFFTILCVIYTFCSEALFAFYQPYFQSIGANIGEYGVFYALISVCSALGALGTARLMRKFDPFSLLLGLMFSVIATLLVLLSRQPSVVYIAVIPSSIGFGIILTLCNTTVQKLISSRHQATALSIASLLRSLAFTMASIGMGVSLDIASPQIVHIGLLIVSVAVLPLFLALRARTLLQ